MPSLTYEEIVEKGVYFLIPEGQAFCHLSICLAEGLQELGIPTYCNKTYWVTAIEPKAYLLEHQEDRGPSDCAVCIVDIPHYPLPGIHENLKVALESSAYKVVLTNSDDMLWLYEFEEFLVFRSHMNSQWKNPPNFQPWAFGISSQIHQATQNPPSFVDKNRRVLINFRPSPSQSVRVAMEFLLVPYLETLFDVDRTTESNQATDSNSDLDADPYFENFHHTGVRQHPNYFKRLKQAQACCCYGGEFFYYDQFPSVGRWDSWRLWESLAAGCITIHLDFEKYGFALPVLPENWRHYIGVDLANPGEIVERVNDEPDLLPKIAADGRQWALEHYSPKATAGYFLDTVLGKDLGTTRELVNLLYGIS